jgi:tRNA threonylcarbamoyladenosine biosynthesis protein TsaE
VGAGKTVFAGGLAEGLGLGVRATSPTFIIARCYPGHPGLLHVDAYRLGRPEELVDLGLGGWAADCVWAVEWADRVRSALPSPIIDVLLTHLPEGRRIEMSSADPRLAAAAERALAVATEGSGCSC